MSIKKSLETAGLALLIMMILGALTYIIIGTLSGIVGLFAPKTSDLERKQLAWIIFILGIVACLLFSSYI